MNAFDQSNRQNHLSLKNREQSDLITNRHEIFKRKKLLWLYTFYMIRARCSSLNVSNRPINHLPLNSDFAFRHRLETMDSLDDDANRPASAHATGVRNKKT